MAPLNLDENALDLPDGRVLGWAEYGAADGVPVIHNHGGLSCRLDVASAAAAAADLGIRLIAPDRPGVASSSRAPDRTVQSWNADVAALADHLGIDRFGVIGWSMGGAYALALAHGSPERVDRVVLLAGTPPLEDTDGLPPLNAMDTRLIHQAREQRSRARTTFRATHQLAEHAPGAFGRISRRDLCPDDAEILDGEEGHRFARAYADATRDADGMVDEYLAWSAPWGFTLGEVATPVEVWQGTADTLVPPAWGEALADRLHEASLHLVPDAGHFLAHRRWPEVLAPLAPPAGS